VTKSKPKAEHECAGMKLWRRQSDLHARQVVDLFWANTQMWLLLQALLPGAELPTPTYNTEVQP
jgi:hypothetical protein